MQISLIKKLNILFSLGVHIGSKYFAKHYYSEMNYFIMCIRNDFFIIDPKKLLFFLKRALYYVAMSACTFSRFLYYHSSVEKSYNFRFIMLYIIKYKGKHSVLNSY
jgi:ribosomal protein S2